MFGSIAVGRLFGITVRVHWMWLAMLLLLPWLAGGQPLGTVLAFLVLFGIVLLHELGHSLMARQFRVRTLDITLWPLGGMARMDHIPEKPKVEFWVAVAGPLVNFALAALGAAVMLPLSLMSSEAETGVLGGSSLEIGWWFVAANVLMGAFNLIPAFPMDGGRVLRAFLGLFTDWMQATSIAVLVGRAFAFAMIALGVIGWIAEWSWSMWMPLLGVFLWMAGARELLSVRLRRAQTDPRFAAFGFRPPWTQGGDPRGTVEPPHEEREPRPPAPEAPDDPSGARRPDITSFDPGARGGMSDDDVRELERFHGRLRPRDED